MPSDFINSILYNDNNINKLFKPLNLLTFNNIFNSSFSTYCAVNSNKVKIFLGQHGSHYGIQKNHLSEQLERRLCHKYFAYGWSNHKNITNISLPPLANKITPYDDKKNIICYK